MQVKTTKQFNKNLAKLNIKIRTRVLVRARSIEIGDSTKNVKQLKGMQPHIIFERKYSIAGGLRLYFTKIDDNTLLYLNIGKKQNQPKDIAQLKSILEDWQNEHRH